MPVKDKQYDELELELHKLQRFIASLEDETLSELLSLLSVAQSIVARHRAKAAASRRREPGRPK